MNNLDKAKEDLSQEWAKIREEQQQKIDLLDENLVQLNEKASGLLGVDEEAADAIFADSDRLESHKKALQTEHTEVNNEWAKRMASKRSEVYKAIRTCPSQMQAARTVFIAAAKMATSAPAAPTAATEDPAITAKNVALLAEVQSLIDDLKELKAANGQADKEDGELHAAKKLTQEESDARKAVRTKAFDELQARIVEARKVRKVFLDKAKSATAEKAAALPPQVSKLPKVPMTTPRKVMPKVSLGPQLPPATPTGSDSFGASLGESAISFGSNPGDVTADLNRQTKKLIKQQKAVMEAKLRKKRKDYYEQPRLTGITKLLLPMAAQLIAESLANDKFNDLEKTVEPRNGDLYIYRCDTKEHVAALDKQAWRNDGVKQRDNKKALPDRVFEQTTYIASSINKEERRYILSDPQHGVQVLHYRLVISHLCITTLKQCTLKT